MKFDAKVLQREMDLAAEELEKAGYLDLAARVDQYSIMLATAKKEDLTNLHRGLSRVQVEYEQREKQACKKEPAPSAAKAQHAVMQARRASIRRKLAMKRYLREKMAQKRKAEKKVVMRKSEESPLKQKLAEKISEAETQLTAAKNRAERLRRIQENTK